MTFMTYVLLGNVISASRVFVAVSLYGAVRLTVTLFFPAAIERASEAVVSIRRIKVQCLDLIHYDIFTTSLSIIYFSISNKNDFLIWFVEFWISVM